VVVIVTLGAFAWDGTLRALKALGHVAPGPRPVFGHGVRIRVGPYLLLGSYHPSQRNTSTKLLSEAALDQVFATARALIESHET
jgi:uracil-DNA glycosylase